MTAPVSDKVLAEIVLERERQDRQWGGPTHDDKQTDNAWIDFIHYQTRDITRPEAARERLIKIAALAIAGVQSIDRRTFQAAMERASQANSPPLPKPEAGG